MNADLAQGKDAVGPPLGLDIVLPGGPGQEAREFRLGDRMWEVVPDESGNLVRILGADPARNLAEGRAIEFRTEVEPIGLVVTKRIGLRRGADAVETRIEFTSARPLEFAYRLQGPYGVPIEGEWYTGTFREVFFGKINGSATEVETKPANEVVERAEKGDPIRATSLPLKFAGIENQYFATFLEPFPLPVRPQDRWDEKTVATVVTEHSEKQKSDISVVIDSRPFKLAPREPLVQEYFLFAGPKTTDVLARFGAEELSSYRKGWQIPLIGPAASFLARTVISPLLEVIYGVTRSAAGVFGGTRGSYGIAIILLTITVRLFMFPLSRKQAQSAKRMQDLQPQMLALREKYKDDREKLGRETMELYRNNGVNPFGGCLLVLIQMPIFLGLWQALNNSVALRHSSFLWIRNLAAPDQLFPFPFEIPLLGGFLGPYFNLLPVIVIVLMLIQTKLFSPPATTPEQKQTQSMMKWMLVFMMLMFYKVPAGLSLYFIMSSLWSIGERLLLPKITHSAPKQEAAPPKERERPAATSPAAKASEPKPDGKKRPGRLEQLRERLEKVLEDAAHDKTARNPDRERSNKEPERRRPRRPPPRGGRRR